MADLLGGDTIHHALNLHVFGRNNDATTSSELRKQSEVATQMLQWRWLIIDEISMVSAKLLADVDCKLRFLSRGNSPFTKSSQGKQHPFGGLNIIFS